jgi:regulatory protein
MPTVTALERQKKNPQRVNVYLDGQFAFGLNEMDAVQLRKGQMLSEAEVAALQTRETFHKAVEHGIQLLSFRPRSTQEIRAALARKHDPQAVENAVERLTAQGYLDDVAFARFWIENRAAFKPMSRQALRYELRQKGVPDEIIQELLAEVGEEEAALAAATRQARRLRGVPRDAFREQMGRFLQRRGFSYSVASQAVRQLQANLAEEDPEFFADA